jgi:hypothetical protein
VSTSNPPAGRAALVIIAILLGIIAGLIAGILACSTGAVLAAAISAGGVAFCATVTLAIVVEKALGLI